MSIDDELRQAVQDSEDNEREAAGDAQLSASAGNAETAAAQPVAVATGDQQDDDESHGGRRNLGMVIGLLVVCAGILAFVFNLDDAEYAKTVGQLMDDRSALEEKKLRVQGILVHGTLKKRDDPCEYRFKMRTKGEPDSEALEVRYESCIIPDTFRDIKGVDVEVTAIGRLASGGMHLDANQILAKCPSKYEMQQRQAAGEAAPHGPGAPVLNPIDTVGKPGAGTGTTSSGYGNSKNY